MGNNLEVVNSFLTRNLYIKPRLISPQKSFFADLGLSSIEYSELIAFLENKYNLTLPDNEILNVQTVEELITIMLRNIPAGEINQ